MSAVAANTSESSSCVISTTADAGFVSMIKTGMMALQLLPPNSAAGLVVVTGEILTGIVAYTKGAHVCTACSMHGLENQLDISFP